MNCSVCGKTLSLKNKKTICSDACKQKRHRMKKGFGDNAMKAAKAIREMANVGREGNIESYQMIICHNDLLDAIRTLSDAIDRAQEIQGAKK